MTRKLIAADLFCGAGGTSIGAEQSGAATVRFAVNHWDVALRTHAANFPNAICPRDPATSRPLSLKEIKPSECPKIDLLFASPECIHHSRARGGKPTSDQQRAGAWEILPWIEHHRPSFVVIENVTEFEQWGPIGDGGRPIKKLKGRFFSAWMSAVHAAGYKTEVCHLNAADFGAATSRERLFVLCRKGNRAPRVPDPTHAKKPGNALPGMQMTPWRGAWEIIDWSLPCPSIFARQRPLADKTLLRIEAGLRRFVEPFVVRMRNHGDAGDVRGPIGTVTAGGLHHGLAVPFQYQLIGLGAGRSNDIGKPIPTMVASRENHGVCVPFVTPFLGERDGQHPRTHSIGAPLPAVTTQNGKGLAVPFLANVNHGDTRHSNGRTADLDNPLGTVTGHNGRAIVLPFLDAYYGNGQASSIDGPLPTVVTKDRHSLILATIDPTGVMPTGPVSPAMAKLLATMRELGVADIGFRMLQNHELSAAQGFPSDYIFHGCKSEVTRQIGNSVSPPVAQGITEALAA